MAQIQLNEDTGLFESVIEDQGVTDQVTDDIGVQDHVLENQENILDDMGVDPVEDPASSDVDQDIVSYDDFITPYAAVDSTAAFTPQAWQVNLADSRQLGEHYLMYANRVYYSGNASYWHYFLVLGSDIDYADDVYTYSDCEVYSYYSYSGTVYYDRNIGSGSVDGNVSLVYSDLYFDYLGSSDSNGRFTAYFVFLILAVLVLLLFRRTRNV